MKQNFAQHVQDLFSNDWLSRIPPELHIPIIVGLTSVATLLGLALVLLFLSRLSGSSANSKSPWSSASQKNLDSDTTQMDDPPDSQSAQTLVEDFKEKGTPNWKTRFREGMQKTRLQFTENLSRILNNRPIDENVLEEIHELLYRADVGPKTAAQLTEVIRKAHGKNAQPPTWEQIQNTLKSAMLAIFEDAAFAHSTPSADTSIPKVILVIGVNGAGKTTSIGKLTALFISQGKSVMLCAADTFRAAAIDQLKVWGERLSVPVIHQKQGSDPAAVAYDAVKAALAKNVDILLIDTAGRLHNKEELMHELAKIKRVIGRDLPHAPHEVWLVIDATTGQNAFQQIKAFKEVANVTGLIVTKLDGTAKGGVIIGATQEFKLPIRFIGIGEKASDLREFDPNDYVASLF